jgi:hypothetical protein
MSLIHKVQIKVTLNWNRPQGLNHEAEEEEEEIKCLLSEHLTRLLTTQTCYFLVHGTTFSQTHKAINLASNRKTVNDELESM